MIRVQRASMEPVFSSKNENLESSYNVIKRELRRIRIRSQKRRSMILGLSALATMLIVLEQSNKPGTHQASVTFRVIEDNVEDSSVAPKTKKKLREYILQGIFTRPNLIQIIEQYGLYPTLRESNIGWAIDELLSDIDVRVTRNYFLKEELDDQTPRSARVQIRFTYRDRQIAEQVVDALATLVREHELAMRRDQTQNAAHAMTQTVNNLKEHLGILETRQAQKNVELPSTTGIARTALQIELAKLVENIRAIEQQLVYAESRRLEQELQAERELQRLGLQFVRVDTERPAMTQAAPFAKWTIVSAIVFLLILPVAATVVSTFDPRIYSVDDIHRLQIDVIGTVPAFAGSTHGAWKQRLSSKTPLA